MTTTKCAKIIGVVCVIAVLCAMFSGTAAVLIMLLVALPLAIYCRHMMTKEDKDIAYYLENNDARYCMKCTCYEGIDDLTRMDECEIFFRRKGIEICYGEKNNKSINLALSRIKELHIYNLVEAMELAKTGMKVNLGKLGESLGFSVKQESVRNIRKDKNVRYLVIKTTDINNNSSILSFYAPAEYYRFNQLASKNEDPVSYIMDRKSGKIVDA